MPIVPANNIEIRDEGATQGRVRVVDFAGSGVSAAVSGSVATVTISAGAGGSATTVEKDLGTTAHWRGSFTITDAGISATSKVLVFQAPGPYTSKGTRADEAEMVRVDCVAIPASGSATVKWETAPVIATCVSRTPDGGGALFNAAPVSVTSKRLNKARGNMKFTYMVFS